MESNDNCFCEIFEYYNLFGLLHQVSVGAYTIIYIRLGTLYKSIKQRHRKKRMTKKSILHQNQINTFHFFEIFVWNL